MDGGREGDPKDKQIAVGRAGGRNDLVEPEGHLAQRKNKSGKDDYRTGSMKQPGVLSYACHQATRSTSEAGYDRGRTFRLKRFLNDGTP